MQKRQPRPQALRKHWPVPSNPRPHLASSPLPLRCPSQVEADIQEQTLLECELLGLRTGLSAALRTVQKGPSFPGLCPSIQGFSWLSGLMHHPRPENKGQSGEPLT